MTRLANLIRHARQLAEITEAGDFCDLEAANKTLRAQARALREAADGMERALRALFERHKDTCSHLACEGCPHLGWRDAPPPAKYRVCQCMASEPDECRLVQEQLEDREEVK